MSNTTLEGFSISHAAILNGTTGAELANGQIYAVRDGTISINISNFDNTGDDAVLSTWFWFDYATLSITGGFIPFSTVALLTGVTISSSGTAPADYYSVPMWQLGSANQPTFPMLMRIPARDSTGLTRNLDIVLFRVQFQPFNFTGPSYKTGLVLNYGGRALLSSTDETGVALTTKTIGRLVSWPGTGTAPGYPFD